MHVRVPSCVQQQGSLSCRADKSRRLRRTLEQHQSVSTREIQTRPEAMLRSIATVEPPGHAAGTRAFERTCELVHYTNGRVGLVRPATGAPRSIYGFVRSWRRDRAEEMPTIKRVGSSARRKNLAAVTPAA